jgi:hypothetical protein
MSFWLAISLGFGAGIVIIAAALVRAIARLT